MNTLWWLVVMAVVALIVWLYIKWHKSQVVIVMNRIEEFILRFGDAAGDEKADEHYAQIRDWFSEYNFSPESWQREHKIPHTLVEIHAHALNSLRNRYSRALYGFELASKSSHNYDDTEQGKKSRQDIKELEARIDRLKRTAPEKSSVQPTTQIHTLSSKAA